MSSQPRIRSKRPTIGIIVEGLDDHYETPLFQYCRDAAREADVNFICFSGLILRAKKDFGEHGEQEKLLAHILAADYLDGIVFPAMILNHAGEALRTHFIAALNNKPAVSISFADPAIPCIDCDNAGGMKAVVNHLIHVHGVKKFAFAYDNDSNDDFRQRSQAFYETIAAAGIPAESVVRTHFGSPSVLAEKIVNGRSEIEAVVCIDDRCAVSISEFYASKGLYVPYDVLVAGFDGMTGGNAIPTITTAQMPFERMCRAAVDLLLSQVSGEKVPMNTRIPAELTIQDSCGCRTSRLALNSMKGKTIQPVETHDRQTKKRPIATLADALSESLAGRSPHAFLDALDCEIRRGFNLGRDTAYWQHRLTLISEARAVMLPAVEDRLALEKLIGLGRIFLSDMMERRARSKEMTLFDKTLYGYSFAAHLASATTFSMVAAEICEALQSRMSIHHGHIILFDPDRLIPDAGRCIIRNNMPCLEKEQQAITVSGYLAELISENPVPASLICNCIKCWQDPLGMSICESDIPDLDMLLNLRNLVGNQVNTLRLVEQVRHQADDLLAANQQLISLRAKEEEYLIAIRRELDLARQIQSDFLPRKLPATQGWDVAVWFEAAKEVSGDFYDVFVLPDDRIGIVIADVSGKSVGAAIFMALVRGLVRALSLRSGGTDLLGVIPAVNDYIVKNHNQASSVMFVTLFFGILDTETGWLEYINAGHLPPVVLKGTRIREFLKLTGPAIGLMDEPNYHTASSTLMRGDTLFAYTDGVTEARGSEGVLMGKDKLYTVLEKDLLTPTSLIAAVKDEVLKHMQGQDIADDITMVALKRI